MKEKEYVFGIHAVIEALDAGREINKIMIQKGANSPLMRELSIKLKPHRKLVQYVPVQKLNYITQKNHQGVIAFLSPITYHHIESIIPQLFEEGKIPLILILDRITDVRNFGAIARTAECMGVDCIVVPKKGGAQVTADAVKTSAGALSRIAVSRVDYIEDTITFLKNSGLTIYGCTEKADANLSDLDMSVPLAMIMGSEEDGISPKFLDQLDAAGKIPMMGQTKSLNVSVAAGMVMYEISNQRPL